MPSHWMPESTITTGIFWLAASFTAGTSATLSSGASTMPSTRLATKFSTTLICSSRSSSRPGPFQITSTPRSSCTLLAPAWIDFQNSCVVPFGITAMRRLVVLPDVEGADFSLLLASPQDVISVTAKTAATIPEIRFMDRRLPLRVGGHGTERRDELKSVLDGRVRHLGGPAKGA